MITDPLVSPKLQSALKLLDQVEVGRRGAPADAAAVKALEAAADGLTVQEACVLRAMVEARVAAAGGAITPGKVPGSWGALQARAAEGSRMTWQASEQASVAPLRLASFDGARRTLRYSSRDCEAAVEEGLLYLSRTDRPHSTLKALEAEFRAVRLLPGITFEGGTARSDEHTLWLGATERAMPMVVAALEPALSGPRGPALAALAPRPLEPVLGAKPQLNVRSVEGLILGSNHPAVAVLRSLVALDSELSDVAIGAPGRGYGSDKSVLVLDAFNEGYRRERYDEAIFEAAAREVATALVTSPRPRVLLCEIEQTFRAADQELRRFARTAVPNLIDAPLESLRSLAEERARELERRRP